MQSRIQTLKSEIERTMLDFTIGYKSHVGYKRTQQEDSYVISRRPQLENRLDALFLVADGMGGGRNGDEASRLVAKSVSDAAYEFLSERYNDSASLDTGLLMQDLLIRANAKVITQGAVQPELRGMATTCVAAVVRDGTLTIGNVGDSRAYLLRYGTLQQLTEDHSEVWKEVMAGRMTPDDARRSPFRNSITRAIGLKSDVKPDVFTHELAEGDTVLLCSDGLTTEVSDALIADILASAEDAQTACDRLVQAALNNGGSDNITVIVMRYGVFTPQLERAPNLEIPLTAPEEEETTDPDWRKSVQWRGSRSANTGRSQEANGNGRSSAMSARRRPEAEENEEEAARPMTGLAVTLIVLLLVLTIGEGIALYLTMKNRTVVYPSVPGGKQVVDLQRKYLNPKSDYQDAKVYYKQPIRESPLRVDTSGIAVVIAKDGTLLRIDLQGKATKLQGAPIPPQETMKSQKRPFVFTLDASGNRYQLNLTDPKNPYIDKFNLGGTRVATKIGSGMLEDPTDLAVDGQGNIFVIDKHILKRIEAVETAEQFNDRLQEENQQNGASQ